MIIEINPSGVGHIQLLAKQCLGLNRLLISKNLACLACGARTGGSAVSAGGVSGREACLRPLPSCTGSPLKGWANNNRGLRHLSWLSPKPQKSLLRGCS